jgi:hypothetical protein
MACSVAITIVSIKGCKSWVGAGVVGEAQLVSRMMIVTKRFFFIDRFLLNVFLNVPSGQLKRLSPHVNPYPELTFLYSFS